MSGHTPGPWHWAEGWDDPEAFGNENDTCSGAKYLELQLLGPGGSEVIPLRIDHYDVIFDAIQSSEMISSADRHLIAAAPDLLRACKMVAEMAVGWQPLTPGDIAEVTAAIAKAEGAEGKP